MTQKKLAAYGSTGRTVRVFLEGDLVRVQWREQGRRRTESWPDSRDNRVRARAFAEGVAQKLDDRHQPRPDEHRPSEVTAIIAACDRRSSRHWRAWVAFTLCATLGRRQRAVLGLQWRDIDWTTRRVTWRAETDKLGREATVPLPRAAVHALRVARVWVARMAPGSRWVFPAVQARRGDRPWTYQAANAALHVAELAAGVPHRPYRALHGFRRSVVTSIHAATGDLELAGEYVGDKDVRTLRRSYLKTRPERLADAARIAGNAVATDKGK